MALGSLRGRVNLSSLFKRKPCGLGFYLFVVLLLCFASNFQVGENEPFVSELLTSLPTTVADLEPHQIHTFYESVCLQNIPVLKSVWTNLFTMFTHRLLLFQVGTMIQAESDPQKRDEYLQRLMELPNQVPIEVEFTCLRIHLSRPLLVIVCLFDLCGYCTEMGWNNWSGTPKCGFPERSRCYKNGAQYTTGVIKLVKFVWAIT